jgi:excisionase family DNA binding protein
MSDLLFPLTAADSVSLAEVAERTGIHIDTLRKKAKRGLIPGGFQIGGGAWRFKRKKFEEWWSGLGEERRGSRRR